MDGRGTHLPGLCQRIGIAEVAERDEGFISLSQRDRVVSRERIECAYR